MSDFDAFWSQFPRRESRAAAMREYVFARRRVSAETILAGLARYLDHLPREAQYIKKPASWLRDGDWDNEYDVPLTKATYPECDHTPRCNSKQWCAVLRQREEAS
jgi:hypothetical protein